MTAYENQLKNLEEERDRFRRELSKYKRSISSKDLDDPQMTKLIREKEDLQLLLNKFERHMAEVEHHINHHSFHFSSIHIDPRQY